MANIAACINLPFMGNPICLNNSLTDARASSTFEFSVAELSTMRRYTDRLTSITIIEVVGKSVDLLSESIWV